MQEINTPIFMFVGGNDELIDSKSFLELFKVINSDIKKVRFIDSNHIEPRDELIIKECFKFIEYIFTTYNNSKNIYQNKIIKLTASNQLFTKSTNNILSTDLNKIIKRQVYGIEVSKKLIKNNTIVYDSTNDNNNATLDLSITKNNILSYNLDLSKLTNLNIDLSVKIKNNSSRYLQKSKNKKFNFGAIKEVNIVNEIN